MGGNASHQSHRHVPLLPSGFWANAPRRGRSDREFGLALRHLRHGKVPWSGGLQRIEIWRRRIDGGDRGGGSSGWHQRHLHQPGSGRHRDAAAREPEAQARLDTGAGRGLDRELARWTLCSGKRREHSTLLQHLNGAEYRVLPRNRQTRSGSARSMQCRWRSRGAQVRPITPATPFVGLRDMSPPIRVMVEQGKKKAVASAFDWPGWDRGGKSEDDALAVLATYRPRYAMVAKLAGLAG